MDNDFQGLSAVPQEPPRVEVLDQPAIELLAPGSALHQRVLKYLLDRLHASEKKMNSFYARWSYAEKRVQAYIDLPDWEKELKKLNNQGKPPRAIEIVVPYTYSTISTIVTYLLQAFTGRKPYFTLGTYKDESLRGARLMEMALQYNADHTRLVKALFQFFQDGELYGVAAMHNFWNKKEAYRTVWKELSGMGLQKSRELRTVYAGNEAQNIDPFMFFPDPNVPMADVNRKGEFVFWRAFPGYHSLLQDQADGILMWVENVGSLPRKSGTDSARGLAVGGDAHAGAARSDGERRGPVQFDQCSIVIVPKELGLGDSAAPERWAFAIGNERQILRAEKVDYDHGMHPVVVAEPKTLGYGFGHLSTADYLGPIQDTLSWLVNSHIANVRQVLNNMLVVDPSLVEMQDLKNPEAGLLIRLKKSAMGRDVRTVVHQLGVHDVTQGHFADFELFMRIGDALAAVNDNLRGQLQLDSSRRTATEIRTLGEAAVSRLSMHARLISAQAMVDLAEQMTLNMQQFMDSEFFIHLAGAKGMEDDFRRLGGTEDSPLAVKPELLVGDFHFPVHDGTLPVDRVALTETWKELFLAVQRDPELRQTYSIGKILDSIAETTGLRGWDMVKVKSLPDGQVQAQAQAGNLVAPQEMPGAGQDLGGGGAPPR